MTSSPEQEDSFGEAKQSGDAIAVFYTSEFKRNVRRLAKKYRHVRQDIQATIEQLLEGQTPGTQMPHVRYSVIKVRVKNSDARRGKSGGYR